MKSDARYVFDTNVIVSAMLFDTSVPGRAFNGALDQGTILISDSLVDELNDVLSRRKFDKYVTSEDRNRFLESLIRVSEVVVVTESIQECRDPEDDRILELAVSGYASFIVTGDSDLLSLNPFRDVEIVTPAEILLLQDEASATDDMDHTD